MRWFISLLIILGLLAGSVYGLNQYPRPVYVPVTFTAEYR